MKRKTVFSAAFVILVWLDYHFKQLVCSKMMPHQSIDIIKDWFALTYVRNYGAAFGIMESQRWLLIIITVALFILVIFKRKQLRTQSLWTQSGILIILAGACGNLLDRGRFGYVIDYLDFHYREIYHWPVFNFADIIICAGMIILVIQTLFDKKVLPPDENDTEDLINEDSEIIIDSVEEDKQ